MGVEDQVPQERRRPVPGKGHRKSRKGCTSCKARRVKCSEELPTCRACRRLRLDCQYQLALPPAPTKSLSNSPPTLSFEDLRFFHYFLIAAHPKLPFSSTNVWQDVAAMSHEYTFLAHACLGLAAQRLTASTSTDYSMQALNHRVQAIAAMNEALSTPGLSPADGDARLAAAIALTFQSTYMDDGMMEFIRMLRGWMIIQTTVVPSMTQSLFRGFTEDAYVDSMRELLVRRQANSSSEISIHQKLDDVLDDLDVSLHLAAPLCQSPGEVQYMLSLQSVSLTARTSPHDACLELVPLYAVTNEMGTDDFADFVSETNMVAQILLAHFWMLSWVLGSHVLGPDHGFDLSESTVLRWAEGAAKRLPESYRKYVLWPLGMSSRQGLQDGGADA
ncbi:hypothetical protein OQA88_5280 [Cercophora sp. LCS_1]